MEKPKAKRIVPALLAWFSKTARDLPWRQTSNPYAIHVSEIMLQQTQVKTVIPYWNRWMRELPDIQALARSDFDKIHKLWEGLGYYTRARNLQKAAQAIEENHGGIFPEAFEAILALPGIGRYTAGAISSIAFNQPKPILDGNVIRVLTRVFGIAENPRDKITNAKLWELARELVVEAAQQKNHESACSHLNQSLMELGALVCTPRAPRCEVCPLQPFCVAYREDRIAELPNLPQRAATTARRFVAFILNQGDNILLQPRPAGVVNAHLWEFPNLEVCDPKIDVAQFAQNIFLKPVGLTKFCTIKHSITRYRITLEVYQVKSNSGKIASRILKQLAAKDFRWLTLEEADSLALTSAHRKVLDQLMA